jgi:hypothetical protein
LTGRIRDEVVGFVHDEILVEQPNEGGHVSEDKVRRVEEIMCRMMGQVLVGDIPVGCEAALSERRHPGFPIPPRRRSGPEMIG